MQTEAFPRLKQHDLVVRVKDWAPDGTIAQVEGFYGVQKVTQNSVRTGARHGQADWDVVGQKATVTRLTSSVGIARMPLVGKKFGPPLVPPVSSMATPPPVQPDVKVVYVPVVKQCEHETPDPAAPITPDPPGVLWRQVYFFEQRIPASTWIIKHPFGYDPSVTLFIDGQEADTDVEYPDEHTAVLTFATPQTGTAQLI
jgi:hypothetical protein